MAEPYVFTDDYGDTLNLTAERSYPGAVFIYGTTSKVVRVRPERLNEFVAALYNLAGRSVAVLDFPPGDYETRANTGWGTFTVGPRKIRLQTDCDHCELPSHRDMPTAAVRNVAAVLAAMADHADDEPDPVQVKAIADVIDTVTNGVGPWTGERIAHALVKAGFAKNGADQ